MQDLILRTRLNLQFAEDCLKNNDWDLERALANYEQVKVRAPFDGGRRRSTLTALLREGDPPGRCVSATGRIHGLSIAF